MLRLSQYWPMLEPATSIIKLCGGVEAVAAMTNRHPTRVLRWMHPKSKGGTGGLIPTDLQEPLLLAAREKGIGLTPDHFYPNFSAAS